VLFVVITAALVAAALLGLGMCRLSALSDSRYAVELAEWVATHTVIEQGMGTTAPPREQSPFDARGEAFRATG
jgi:hypothetical protein